MMLHILRILLVLKENTVQKCVSLFSHMIIHNFDENRLLGRATICLRALTQILCCSGPWRNSTVGTTGQEAAFGGSSNAVWDHVLRYTARLNNQNISPPNMRWPRTLLVVMNVMGVR